MREALLNVEETSRLLHVHPQTVYEWKRSGKLPSVTVNGRVRFEQKQLDEFLKRRQARFIDPEAILQRVSLPLDSYDRIHLKGGKRALNKNARRWNYGFGTVFLRKTEGGPDHWYIEYRWQGKRTKKALKAARTREEALIALQARVAGTLNGGPGPRQTAELMSFGDFADKYLNEYAKSEKTSWKTDEYKLHPIREFFGAAKAGGVTEVMIREFREARLRAGISKTTTNRYLALIRKMYNWAKERGLLSSNPVKGIKMFSESDRVRDRVLRPDEEERLFAELPLWVQPIILTLLHTGLRLREGLYLTWDNVDLERRRIKVEKTKSKRARIIPINSELLRTLEGLRADSKGPRVFPFKTERTARTDFENARERAGLADFNFHDLRRTFGTRLLEHGVDIVTISKLYGHSSVLVTQRYLHPSDDLSIEAVEFLASGGSKRPKEAPVLSQVCPKIEAPAVPVPVNPGLRAS